MHDIREQPVTSAIRVLAVLLASFLAGACPPAPTIVDAVLRVGVGGMQSQTADRGVQQFLSNLSNESLARVNPEGRVEPWLAESVTTSADGRRLTLRLRPNVTFHDGSAVDTSTVVQVLRQEFPKIMRSAFDDVESIEPGGDREIVFKFRQPSAFVGEAFMDLPLLKPGHPTIATGPFAADKALSKPGAVEMKRFDGYYLGRPNISRIIVNSYASTRAAWAEMLRDQLDVLYEVDIDAIDSMRDSTKVSLYSFDRPYQYVVVLNSRLPKLQSAAVRRALNQAIDRPALIREGLAGQGTASEGPVPPHHWAFQPSGSTFTYAPAAMAPALKESGAKGLSIHCLTVPGVAYERLALVLKQQLKAVGVDFDVEEQSADKIAAAMRNHDFDAALIDPASGFGMFRVYRLWTQTVDLSTPALNKALNDIQHAANDGQYRAGVAALQQTMSDDPLAIFLAWGSRARAVAKRFDVQAQPGRDILTTLRMWRPSADNRKASFN